MPVGVRFFAPAQTDFGPTKPAVQWVPPLLLQGKVAGRGVNNPPPSSADVKERLNLYPTSHPPLGLHGLL